MEGVLVEFPGAPLWGVFRWRFNDACFTRSRSGRGRLRGRRALCPAGRRGRRPSGHRPDQRHRQPASGPPGRHLDDHRPGLQPRWHGHVQRLPARPISPQPQRASRPPSRGSTTTLRRVSTTWRSGAATTRTATRVAMAGGTAARVRTPGATTTWVAMAGATTTWAVTAAARTTRVAMAAATTTWAAMAAARTTRVAMAAGTTTRVVTAAGTTTWAVTAGATTTRVAMAGATTTRVAIATTGCPTTTAGGDRTVHRARGPGRARRPRRLGGTQLHRDGDRRRAWSPRRPSAAALFIARRRRMVSGKA